MLSINLGELDVLKEFGCKNENIYNQNMYRVLKNIENCYRLLGYIAESQKYHEEAKEYNKIYDDNSNEVCLIDATQIPSELFDK